MKMVKVSDLLLELERCLLESKNPILDYLENNDAFGKNLFDKNHFLMVIENIGLEATSELIELYEWKSGVNGQNLLSLNFDYRMCDMGSFIDWSSATSLYLLDKSTNKFFTKRFLPVIYNGIMEDPILIDLSKKSKTRGQLFYFSPNVTLSSKPVSIYDSLQTWIETMIESYDNNIYVVNEQGILEVTDKNKKLEITRRLNPNSQFWKW